MSERTSTQLPDAHKPQGLRPRWILDEHRRTEIRAAIERYSSASMEIPEEWLDELQGVEARLSEHT